MKKAPVSLPVSFENRPAEDLKLLAYAFNAAGELVETVPVLKEKAEFKQLEEDIREYRILLAPDNEKTAAADNVNQLLSLKAYEPVVDFDEKGDLSLLPIPDLNIQFWLRVRCRVRGSLVKAFTLNGRTEDKPVCKARVHICEIDRIYWLLPRIPDFVIERIPDFIFNPELPFPIPQGPWPPVPDPIGPVAGLFDQPFEMGFNKKAVFNPRTLPVAAQQQRAAQSDKAVISEAVTRISPAIKANLASKNIGLIRETLLRNFQLFHPIFCRIPWLWPYLYRSDEIKTVYTDNYGRFDTTILYSLPGDHPDLYFWVEYFINGAWVTVYRPSIPCHTWWDFACGSSVNIRITDPRVPWRCDNIIYGSKVWIKTVGRSTSIARIKQANTTAATAQGHMYYEQGLTDVALYASPNRFGGFRRPFAGSLSVMVQFSFDLPFDGIKYYRWSARKRKNADMTNATGSFQQLDSPLAKSYAFSYIQGGQIKMDGYDSLVLGPLNVGTATNLFAIPPVDVATISKPGQLYPWWHDGQNTVSVGFDSKSLGDDGLYELRLELFDKNGALVAVDPKVFQVPDAGNFSQIDAPTSSLVINGAGKATSFNWLLRVDNNPAQGEVYKIKTDPDGNGVFEDASANCCGFVKYNAAADGANQVKISFRAYHPHNFADFDFGVVKGTCGDTPASDSAMVIGSSDKYTRDGASVFSHDFSPIELLGECALQTVNGVQTEGKAAFAQVLGVQPLAIDGNYQVFGNVSSVAAFALEPQ